MIREEQVDRRRQAGGFELIGLGIYILRGYIFKPAGEDKWKDFDSAKPAPLFVSASSSARPTGEYETFERGRDQRYGGWGNS